MRKLNRKDFLRLSATIAAIGLIKALLALPKTSTQVPDRGTSITGLGFKYKGVSYEAIEVYRYALNKETGEQGWLVIFNKDLLVLDCLNPPKWVILEEAMAVAARTIRENFPELSEAAALETELSGMTLPYAARIVDVWLPPKQEATKKSPFNFQF